MEDVEGRVEVVTIDLNEEPTEESSWIDHDTINDLDDQYTRIEERIRRLEAVTFRARQRQGLRLSRRPVNAEAFSLNEEIGQAEVNVTPTAELNPVAEESLDGLKRSSSHLLELALGIESDSDPQAKKNAGEGFFDCNICLGKAREPILTCCGHLYCWPCFYVLPDMAPSTKECPTCNGEVNEKGITPIYGSSDKALKIDADKSGVIIPPRPPANRIESLRQQRITRGSHSIRIEEVLRTLHSFSTQSGNLASALSSAERRAEDLEGMAHLYHPTVSRDLGVFETDINSDNLVEVPFEAVATDATADTETGLPSSSTRALSNGTTSAMSAMQHFSRRISPRRRIRIREHFTDVSIPRSRTGGLLMSPEQEQLPQPQPSIAEQQVQIPRSRRRMRLRSLEQEQLPQLSIAEQEEQHQSRLRSGYYLEARIMSLYGVFDSEEDPPIPNAPPEIDNTELLPVSDTLPFSNRSSDNVLGSTEPRRGRRRRLG